MKVEADSVYGDSFPGAISIRRMPPERLSMNRSLFAVVPAVCVILISTAQAFAQSGTVQGVTESQVGPGTAEVAPDPQVASPASFLAT